MLFSSCRISIYHLAIRNGDSAARASLADQLTYCPADRKLAASFAACIHRSLTQNVTENSLDASMGLDPFGTLRYFNVTMKKWIIYRWFLSIKSWYVVKFPWCYSICFGNGTSPGEFQIDPFLSDHTITKWLYVGESSVGATHESYPAAVDGPG